MVWIKDMTEGMRIVNHFFCVDKTLCKGKTGKDYISVTLRDRTGTVSGKIWDINSKIHDFESGDFVKIDAEVSSYKGEIQLRIIQARKSNPGEYDPKDYSPASSKEIDAMMKEVDAWMSKVTDPYMNQLLYMFFKEDPVLVEKIRQHPAAKSIHHSFIGGYLEHVTSVTKMAYFMARQYRHINEEIVITAALLHDIGKLRELSPMPEALYTFEGNLLGHITIGYEMVHDAITRIPQFPRNLAIQLEHIMLSHHGELEFGSPKQPMTMEAMVVHLADNCDAKMKQLEEFIDKDTNPGEWTARNMVLARSFYKGDSSDE